MTSNCQHCFCQFETIGVVPHKKCCMCGARIASPTGRTPNLNPWGRRQRYWCSTPGVAVPHLIQANFADFEQKVLERIADPSIDPYDPPSGESRNEFKTRMLGIAYGRSSTGFGTKC